MRVPDISIGELNRLSPAHSGIQQDLYLQRCEQRRKDKIKRLRKALKERTVAHTVSSTFAGINIWVEGAFKKPSTPQENENHERGDRKKTVFALALF